MPLARPITDDEIQQFEETGVVHLKGLFSQDWVVRMQEAVERALSHPGELANDLSHGDPNGKFVSETFLWHQHPGFRDFVYDSPAGEIAATVMRSAKSNIIFDQHLVKGRTRPSPRSGITI